MLRAASRDCGACRSGRVCAAGNNDDADADADDVDENEAEQLSDDDDDERLVCDCLSLLGDKCKFAASGAVAASACECANLRVLCVSSLFVALVAVRVRSFVRSLF